MDIKESNIFLSLTSDWYLGDFGSSKFINEAITSTNIEFYVGGNLRGTRAKCEYDWFMLLVVLLRQVIYDPPNAMHILCDKDVFSVAKISNFIDSIEDENVKIACDELKELSKLNTIYDLINNERELRREELMKYSNSKVY
jgi:serine/threonine protein kinase